MGPKSRHHAAEPDLFRLELVNLIDQRHELVKLAALIDWPAFEQAWGPKFESTTGRPVLPTRLMASLLYLKHTFVLSDEDVVKRWSENPYWQHFSGERCFRHELPCDPSSLVRWRQRIGEEGCEWLLEYSIKAAMSAGVVKRQSLDTVVVDTTVQPKAIAHPTDSRLLNRVREQLGAAAQEAGIELRQSYARVGKTADAQAGRYAHAQQWRRMRREVKKLRTWLGRFIRDVQRKAGELGGVLKTRMETAQRLHAQQRDSKNKLYALHAPELECIAKHVLRLSRGQGPNAVRVRCEDLGGRHGQRGRGGRHALDARFTVRRPHVAQPVEAGGDPHGRAARHRAGRPGLPRRGAA